MESVYEQLRQRLDDMGTGFPATSEGVEVKILEKLFTPADARMFLMMTPMLETPEAAAERLELPGKETADHLEDMAGRGLLFRQKKGGQVRYAAVPFVVGIYEFQLNHVDRELAVDLDAYYEAALGKTFQSYNTPVMRTIPINTEFVSEWPVAPYEDALRIIDSQNTIALAPCICRTTARKAGRGCDKPLETCFLFGSHAHYYVDNGMGRYIDRQEAREIIKKNDEAGLVMQPFNSKHVGGMCSCCGCCCGMLRSLKKQSSPAEAVKSNFYAQVDEQICTGCGTCVERCQMEAVELGEQTALVDLNRCIGCGLCVSSCPTGAMELVKKAEEDIYTPPENGMETYLRIARERGRM
ncbi:MAG: 4Fe-4S dicluster domain-containing protein [Desulfosalsimonadaceae bacterium]